MELKTISCSKKIMAELAINIDRIEYKDSSTHGNKEVFEFPFTISVDDGLDYHGKILLWKNHSLGFYVFDVKSLAGNLAIKISKDNIITECSTKDSRKIPNAKYLYANVSDQTTTFLKGSFTIKFEPKYEKLVEEKLLNSFSLLKQDQVKGPNDVKLVFQGKEYEFNMSLLTKISSVFKDISEHHTSLVGEKIPIMNERNDATTLQTMETFHKILVQKSVEPQEITVDLYIFADKYDIKPLVHFCGEYLGSKINKENVLEIAVAADRADDEVLLKKAATFLLSNPCEKFHEFFKKNPDFAKNLFLSKLKK